MPNERVFVFVRHGEARANVEGRVNSLPDRPNDLTERGREQARTCAVLLGEVPFDEAYCSAFPRARQTAELALAGRPVPLLTDPRINETGAFAFDGEPCAAWHAALVPDRFRATPPGCEPFGPFKARLVDFLRGCWATPARRIAVFSHEEPIQVMLGVLEGLSDAAARARPIPHCQPFLWRGERFPE